MASTIAAITTGIGGIVTTADATGNLSLLSGTSTIVAVTSAGAAVTGTLTASTPIAATSGGTGLSAVGTAGNLLTSNGTIWTSAAAPAGGVTTFNGSTTGLTPATATSGAITLGGTLAVANGGTGVTTSTGTGAVVLGTSPTLTTPILGTPTSGNLANCTGIPAPAALSTASGSAPSYSARAWVNFNGTGTVAIRASGNVSSITDNGTGDYTVNFTTAMSDANYSSAGLGGDGAVNTGGITINGTSAPSTTAIRISFFNHLGSAGDKLYMCLSIFR